MTALSSIEQHQALRWIAAPLATSCVDRKPDGLFRIREDEPRPRVRAADHMTPSAGNALRDERMSEVFQYLIETSALPLVPVEQGNFSPFELGDFSIDASVVDGASRNGA